MFPHLVWKWKSKAFADGAAMLPAVTSDRPPLRPESNVKEEKWCPSEIPFLDISGVVCPCCSCLGSMPQLETLSLVAMQTFGTNDLPKQITIKQMIQRVSAYGL